MGKVNDEVSLMEALATLIDKETELAVLSVSEKRKEISKAVKGKIESIVTNLKEQEKMYGANSEQYKGIEQEYKEKLAEIRANYNSGMDELTAQKLKIQEEAQEKAEDYARKQKFEKFKKESQEYKDWKKEYDIKLEDARVIGSKGTKTAIEQYRKRMQELKKFEEEKSPLYKNSVEMQKLKEELEKSKRDIIDIEKKEQNLRKEAMEAIEKADNQKETALTKRVKPQNALQKFIGGFLNKFGGKQKFEKNVLEPLKANLKTFKEETVPGFTASAKAVVGDTKLGKSIMTLIDESRKAKIEALNRVKGKIIGKSHTVSKKIEQINNKNIEEKEM